MAIKALITGRLVWGMFGSLLVWACLANAICAAYFDRRKSQIPVDAVLSKEIVMARIRLSSPFDIRPFSDLFRAVALEPVEEDERTLGHINLDVLETPDAYVIDAELPGVAREHIHVTIDRSHVEISVQARPRASGAGEHMLCRERHEGLFYRSFSLAHDIDDAAAKARFADGVLALTLPKKRGGGEHRLEIK
jgi:HSP20 family protein